MHTMLAGTVGTTEEGVGRLHAVTDNAAAAMRAGWRQRMDGALKAIEYVCLAAHTDFETFIIGIAAYLTGGWFVAKHVFLGLHLYLFSMIPFGGPPGPS
jgi:hypothetical protein